MGRRPEPTHAAPDGYRWTVASHPYWRLAEGKRCRAGAGYRRPMCGAPCVAEFNRIAHRHGGENWWAYCADHLYTNWIEDGRVVYWALTEDTDQVTP